MVWRLFGWLVLAFGRLTRIRHFPHQSAAGNFHEPVLAGLPIHSLAHPILAVLGYEARLIILADQVIQVVIGLKDHLATPSAVAPAGTAFGDESLPMKGHAAFAAMTGARIDFDLVDKHTDPLIRNLPTGKQKRRGCWPRP